MDLRNIILWLPGYRSQLVISTFIEITILTKRVALVYKATLFYSCYIELKYFFSMLINQNNVKI